MKKQDIGQLPCRCFFLLQKDQLRQHESYLGQVDSDLAEHTRHPPERGAKVRVIQDYVDKETYLQFEVRLVLSVDFAAR